MKRILIAGMHHESNSFNPLTTFEKDFKVIYGKEIFDNLRGNDAISGIIKTLQGADYQVIPTVYARAVPNGEVDFDFYMKLKNEIINRARAAAEETPIDALTLALHGSMRVKNLGEAEGYLLEELRKLFPDIPIFCSLDMHTTMSRRMHSNCDGFVGFKTAPHIDCFETGEHAAKMTIDTLENKAKAKSAWVKVPILIAGEQSVTSVQPMVELIKELRECEKKEGIMAASYLMGFPWADSEDSSVGVYIVANGNLKLAHQEAIRLADLIWSNKDKFCFHTETYDEKTALDVSFKAISEGNKPIYISDSGDNPTAGASSDGTDFLKLIMDDNRTEDLNKPIIYGGIFDPVATKECQGRIGEEITLTFGGRFNHATSNPITTTGIVKAYINDWTREGMPKGDLALFSSRGVDIVLAEVHVGYITPEMFSDLGVNPKEADMVICKLGYLTPQHSEIASRSIMALTRGDTNEDLKKLKYKKLKRPIFPLDTQFEFSASHNLIEREE